MFSVEVLPNGDLKVCAGNKARTWIKDEQLSGRFSDSILQDGMEHYWTNGGFEPFGAGEANPFVGLTCAPCIAETLDVLDNGEREVVGRLWYFDRYAIEDPMEQLKRTGKVVFNLAR